MEEAIKMEKRTTSTESVLAKARAGNKAVIDQLALTSWPKAYAVALRILRCHADAEEVAQDSVWTAVTHLSSFRENSSYWTWLHRIVVNNSIMALRHKRVRALGSAVPLSLNVPPPCMPSPRTPEELLLEDEIRRFMDVKVTRLPAGYAVALRLAEEGQSIKEIADAMGISPSAVKARLHRGRVQLRQQCGALALREKASTLGSPRVFKGCESREISWLAA
jgi:RNA polymerase sigma-70 factor (ECF subfamily)